MTDQLKQLSEAATEEAKFLIQKSGAYYRPNSQGYTNSAIQAGRYTRSEAISITHPNGPDGPRDNMRFFHEDDVVCEDWKSYRALEAQLTEARAREAVAYEVAADEVQKWSELVGVEKSPLPNAIRALADDHTTALEQTKQQVRGEVLRAMTLAMINSERNLTHDELQAAILATLSADTQENSDGDD